MSYRWLLASVPLCMAIMIAGCAQGDVTDDDGSNPFQNPSGGGMTGQGGTPVGPGQTSGPSGGMGGMNAGGMTASSNTNAATTNASSSNVTATATSSNSSASSSNSSSSASSSANSSSSGMMCPPQPTNVMGCSNCFNCPFQWPVSWGAVSGATHYIVEYVCFITTTQYQTSSTNVDLCNTVGMCNDSMCANGVTSVGVKACNANCCSALVPFPANGIPIACGGGVCC